VIRKLCECQKKSGPFVIIRDDKMDLHHGLLKHKLAIFFNFFHSFFILLIYFSHAGYNARFAENLPKICNRTSKPKMTKMTILMMVSNHFIDFVVFL
jgi:hypothetical protein